MYYQVLFHCFPRVIKSNSCLLETNNKKDDTEKEDSFVIPQVGISSMNSLIYILQFSSVDQSCPTLCDPMNCSTPGLPVHHQLPEFTQTHVHRVGDGIQPSHPLYVWEIPGPGIEHVSPALTGGFLTTGPPGKSVFIQLLIEASSFKMWVEFLCLALSLSLSS